MWAKLSAIRKNSSRPSDLFSWKQENWILNSFLAQSSLIIVLSITPATNNSLAWSGAGLQTHTLSYPNNANVHRQRSSQMSLVNKHTVLYANSCSCICIFSQTETLQPYFAYTNSKMAHKEYYHYIHCGMTILLKIKNGIICQWQMSTIFEWQDLHKRSHTISGSHFISGAEKVSESVIGVERRSDEQGKAQSSPSWQGFRLLLPYHENNHSNCVKMYMWFQGHLGLRNNIIYTAQISYKGNRVGCSKPWPQVTYVWLKTSCNTRII